jgi:hypothetical protein
MRIKSINWQALITALLLTVLFALPSSALSSNIIESQIEGVTGFRFENLMFGDDHVTFDVVNMTNKNVKFSASVFFVDIRGRIVAEIDLLPNKITANSKSSYKCFFVTGSGEIAKRCDKVLWRPQVIMQ